MFKTGNDTSDKLTNVQFSGNVIPHQWYKTILTDKGKPDGIAMMILADIVYWYRPTEIRSEKTGQTIGYKKKFKADLLQRDYDAISEMMGFSRSQAKDALVRLEKAGIVTRVFRHFHNRSNVMYLELHYDRLMEVTFGDIDTDTPCEEISPDGIDAPPCEEISPDGCAEISPDDVRKKPHTYTEITFSETTLTENTTTTKKSDAVAIVVSSLMELRITKKSAVGLISKYGIEKVEKYLPLLKNAKQVKRPAAWLATAIERNYDTTTTPMEGFVVTKYAPAETVTTSESTFDKIDVSKFSDGELQQLLRMYRLGNVSNEDILSRITVDDNNRGLIYEFLGIK